MKRLVRGFSVLALVLFVLTTGGLLAQGHVDINSADVETLKTLQGIGDVRANAIIKYREMNGPFQSFDDLKQVTGIGDKIIQDNRAAITFGPGSGGKMSEKPSQTMMGGKKADMGTSGKRMTDTAEKAMPHKKDAAKKTMSKTQ